MRFQNTRTQRTQCLLSIVSITVVCAGTLCSSAAAKGAWFTPDKCEFKVEFPTEPEVSKQYVEGAGYLYSASSAVRGDKLTTVVFVAEGMPIDPTYLQDVDKASFLLERARQYATFNGLEHVEYESAVTDIGHTITFRGGKTVGGVRALYMGKIVLGERSFIALRGGGAAESFPQKGLLDFMASVRRQ